MQGGQEPRRPRREQEPGRGVYVARRIVAALVVVLLLVLLVPWAWQTLTRSEEEPGSEAPEVAETSGTGGGEEETTTPQESAGESSEVAEVVTVVVRPGGAGGEEVAAPGGAGGIEAATDLTGTVAVPEAAAGNNVTNARTNVIASAAPEANKRTTKRARLRANRS